MAILYRFAETTKDLAAIGKLEAHIWGLKHLDIVPVSVLRTIMFSGGCVILAESDNELVGFCVGLPARLPEGLGLWSYVAGVHDNLQGKAIGKTLKFKQREWAAEQGLVGIAWTFDPLQGRNANFNLNHLGAVARRYHENVYGEMNDAINRGLPSDRLEVWWDIQQEPSYPPKSPNSTLIIQNHENTPVVQPIPDSGNTVLIPIPNTIIRHNLSAALQWQSAIREQFDKAFSLGFVAEAVVWREQQAYYQLTRKTSRTS